MLINKSERINQAINKLCKIADIKNYYLGINWIKNNLNKNWFQSTEEIIVILELIKNWI